MKMRRILAVLVALSMVMSFATSFVGAADVEPVAVSEDGIVVRSWGGENVKVYDIGFKLNLNKTFDFANNDTFVLSSANTLGTPNDLRVLGALFELNTSVNIGTGTTSALANNQRPYFKAEEISFNGGEFAAIGATQTYTAKTTLTAVGDGFALDEFEEGEYSEFDIVVRGTFNIEPKDVMGFSAGDAEDWAASQIRFARDGSGQGRVGTRNGTTLSSTSPAIGATCVRATATVAGLICNNAAISEPACSTLNYSAFENDGTTPRTPDVQDCSWNKKIGDDIPAINELKMGLNQNQARAFCKNGSSVVFGLTNFGSTATSTPTFVAAPTVATMSVFTDITCESGEGAAIDAQKTGKTPTVEYNTDGIATLLLGDILWNEQPAVIGAKGATLEFGVTAKSFATIDTTNQSATYPDTWQAVVWSELGVGEHATEEGKRDDTPLVGTAVPPQAKFEFLGVADLDTESNTVTVDLPAELFYHEDTEKFATKLYIAIVDSATGAIIPDVDLTPATSRYAFAVCEHTHDGACGYTPEVTNCTNPGCSPSHDPAKGGASGCALRNEVTGCANSTCVGAGHTPGTSPCTNVTAVTGCNHADCVGAGHTPGTSPCTNVVVCGNGGCDGTETNCELVDTCDNVACVGAGHTPGTGNCTNVTGVTNCTNVACVGTGHTKTGSCTNRDEVTVCTNADCNPTATHTKTGSCTNRDAAPCAHRPLCTDGGLHYANLVINGENTQEDLDKQGDLTRTWGYKGNLSYEVTVKVDLGKEVSLSPAVTTGTERKYRDFVELASNVSLASAGSVVQAITDADNDTRINFTATGIALNSKTAFGSSVTNAQQAEATTRTNTRTWGAAALSTGSSADGTNSSRIAPGTYKELELVIKGQFVGNATKKLTIEDFVLNDNLTLFLGLSSIAATSADREMLEEEIAVDGFEIVDVKSTIANDDKLNGLVNDNGVVVKDTNALEFSLGSFGWNEAPYVMDMTGAALEIELLSKNFGATATSGRTLVVWTDLCNVVAGTTARMNETDKTMRLSDLTSSGVNPTANRASVITVAAPVAENVATIEFNAANKGMFYNAEKDVFAKKIYVALLNTSWTAVGNLVNTMDRVDNMGTITPTTAGLFGAKLTINGDTDPQGCVTCDFGAWEVATAATCKDKGSEKRTCKACGKVETREIAVKAHVFGEAEVVEATCTEDGSSTKTCTACGEKDVTVIAAGCKPSGTVTVTTEPTCTEKGTASDKCTVCDKGLEVEIDALGHNVEVWTPVEGEGVERGTCVTCGQEQERDWEEPIKPGECTEHKWDAGTVTEEATYEKEGVKTFTCTNEGCTGTKTEAIPKLTKPIIEDCCDKPEADDGTVTKKATCTEEGEMTFKCKNCGTEAEEKGVVAKIPHALDEGTVTKKATCEVDGEMTYKCENCEYTKVEVIEADPEICEGCDVCVIVPAYECNVSGCGAGDEPCTCIHKGNVKVDDKIDIGDALELLKYLARMKSTLDNNPEVVKAAIIVVPTTGTKEKPVIGDALELLKCLARMKSLVVKMDVCESTCCVKSAETVG